MQEFFSIGSQSLHLSPKMSISCGMPLQVHMEQKMIHAPQALLSLQADTSCILLVYSVLHVGVTKINEKFSSAEFQTF